MVCRHSVPKAELFQYAMPRFMRFVQLPQVGLYNIFRIYDHYFTSFFIHMSILVGLMAMSYLWLPEKASSIYFYFFILGHAGSLF